VPVYNALLASWTVEISINGEEGPFHAKSWTGKRVMPKMFQKTVEEVASEKRYAPPLE